MKGHGAARSVGDDLLAGQPAPCEIRAERERPGLVVVTDALLRKAGGEALGLAPPSGSLWARLGPGRSPGRGWGVGVG